MTLDQIYQIYETSYRASKALGISRSQFHRWKKCGYIPILAQIKIEKLTHGKLKADINFVTIEDVLVFFGNIKTASQQIGVSYQRILVWKRKKYIPLHMQHIIKGLIDERKSRR